MAKQLSFGEDARRRLKAGTDTLTQAVETTLGPKAATSGELIADGMDQAGTNGVITVEKGNGPVFDVAYVEDALSATRAALEEGVVPGGVVALLNAMEAIRDLRDDEPDINIGIDIVRRALEEPLRQIANNAGKIGAVVINEVRRRHSAGGSIGFNVLTEAYEDMLEAGIIDPAKVTRSAVENAASIAAMILTTEVLIADISNPRSIGDGMGPLRGMM